MTHQPLPIGIKPKKDDTSDPLILSIIHNEPHRPACDTADHIPGIRQSFYPAFPDTSDYLKLHGCHLPINDMHN